MLNSGSRVGPMNSSPQNRNRRANCNRRAFVPSGGLLSLMGARNPAVGVSITGVASGVVLLVAAAVYIVSLNPL